MSSKVAIYTLKLMILGYIFGLLFLLDHMDAFVFDQNSFPGRKHAPFCAYFAKPPPKASFDLEAIESFEEKLRVSSQVFVEKSSEEDDDGDVLKSEDDNNVRRHVVPPELHNKRTDAVIAALEPQLSRSHCGNLVTDGNVRIHVDGTKLLVMDRKATKLEAGTELEISLPKDETPNEIVAQNLPIDILYEDEYMIVLNKAADMVVHPAVGNWDGTVVNALAYYLANESPYGSGDFVGSKNCSVLDATDEEAFSFRPGIVHRLDKGTTGVLVVAKTGASLAALSEAFKARTVKKTYLAVTVGNPGKRVVIDKPIGRHPTHRQRMRVVPDPHRRDSRGIAPKDRMAVVDGTPSQVGRQALSVVDTIAFDGKLSLVQVKIETGRTHQIRVHLQDRTTPVYGDEVYGFGDWNKKLSKTHQIDRPLLHAYTLELDHPVTRERLVFRAPLAPDMLKIAKGIQNSMDERPDLFEQ